MIIQLIQKPVLYAAIAMLIFNLTQRNHLSHGEKKRFASLYFAGIFFLLYIGLTVIIKMHLPDFFIIPAIAVFAVLLIIFKKNILVFKFHCMSCKKKLPLKRILYFDSNFCPECDSLKDFKDVSAINWQTWEPEEKAVLCYIKKGNEILLIHKKKGLGAGKINAPGGRIEAEETSLEAAVRETEEEVGITPLNLKESAELSFIFTNGYSLHGTIFFSEEYSGTLIETDEAAPFWCNIDKIPYNKMLEDDILWLPSVLKGEYIKGYFIFNDDNMLSHKIIKK